MRININLEEREQRELKRLVKMLEIYIKEKRVKENILFFIELYNKGIINKDLLFLLLPRNEAEAIIIGAKFGKSGAELVKKS